jgi:halimadienyl-diphosphate synthase
LIYSRELFADWIFMADIHPIQPSMRPNSELIDNLPSTVNRRHSLDLEGEIHTLLGRLGESRVEPVAYDTAWIARLGDIDNKLSAEALEWLRAHQLPDGGWGASMPLYHHDRVISTLSAIIALTLHGAAEDRPRIAVALPVLQHSLASLDQDVAGRTIAFEMLLPSLVAEATSLGLKVEDPDGVVHSMSRLRDAKLARTPKGLISRHTTMGFSAEMVGPDGLHLLDVDNLQQWDGSVSVNPAATAFFATYVRPDSTTIQYLRQVVRNGGAPAITNIDIFEFAWALWNLTRGQKSDPLIESYRDSLLDQLALAWHPEQGIAHNSTAAVPDGDDTGLVYELFAQFGRTPDPAALWHYEEETHFRCFDLESHPSVIANIHILGALRQSHHSTDHPAVQKITAFLQSEKDARHFWADKWHISPYYPTCRAIIVCSGYVDQLVDEAIDWLMQTQNPDGSWGYFSPTSEETAYALQALMVRQQQGYDVPNEMLRRAVGWLAEHVAPPYPPLWIGKSLYCPTLVVQSAIISVLRQYENNLGA